MTLGAKLQNIPILAGKLNYETRATADLNYSATNLLDGVINNNFPSFESPNVQFGHSESAIEDVFRPFKLGVNAVYNPSFFKS